MNANERKLARGGVAESQELSYGQSMKRSVQTILLAVGLVVASCQCILTCASEPVPASASSSQSTSDLPPPCHEHNSSEHGKVPQNCAHSPVVAEEQATAISSPSLAVLPHD